MSKRFEFDTREDSSLVFFFFPFLSISSFFPLSPVFFFHPPPPPLSPPEDFFCHLKQNSVDIPTGYRLVPYNYVGCTLSNLYSPKACMHVHIPSGVQLLSPGSGSHTPPLVQTLVTAVSGRKNRLHVIVTVPPSVFLVRFPRLPFAG